MIDEHADFLREAVAVVARELMEAEVTTEIGARRLLPCIVSEFRAEGWLSGIVGLGASVIRSHRRQI